MPRLRWRWRASSRDRDRQFFNSQIGLPSPWQEQRQTPLTHSFCQWVVAVQEELVISDARTHPVLSQNKAISDLGFVAYAGVPLQASNGQPLGAFCAIDGESRTWKPEELSMLRDLAQVIDAYTALGVADRAAGSGPLSNPVLRATARVAGQGFFGASRVLRRCGRMPDEEHKRLIGIIERNGQMLAAVSTDLVSACP
jgi:signal transduction protein with GAF and PtsI domain